MTIRHPRALVAAAVLFAVAVGLAALLHSSHDAPAAAAKTVNVRLSDFKVRPSATRAAPGRVTFVVHNVGHMEHELVVIRTSRSASRLPVHGTQASERGDLGEVEDLKGGATKRLTLRLARGHYALICNVAGHYEDGMHADLTVR